MGRQKISYAKLLTKDYLDYLHITDVSEDGKHIYKDGIELQQNLRPDGYLTIQIYDPAFRQLIPAEERTNSTGQRTFGVHRVVYAWFKNICPEGMVVDHLNNDKTDNRIENLQLLTPGENVWKDRTCNKYECYCSLERPRKYYEDKLKYYLEEYEKAKQEHNAVYAHKLRSNISQTRARLRYYDNHIKDYVPKARNRYKPALENYHELAKKRQALQDLIDLRRALYKTGPEEDKAQNHKLWKEAIKMYNDFVKEYKQMKNK